MYELGIVSDSGGQGGGSALNLRAPWRSRYLHRGRWPGHVVDEHDQPHTLPPSLVFGVFVVFYSVPCVSINALDGRLSSRLRQIRALTGMSAAGVWRKEMASTCTENEQMAGEVGEEILRLPPYGPRPETGCR